MLASQVGGRHIFRDVAAPTGAAALYIINTM
jgi:hypothetical protein